MKILPKLWAVPALLTILVAVPAALGATNDPVISEFVAANADSLADEDGDHPDWIEIHNPGNTTVNLLNWALTDSSGDLSKWRFPATNIGPSGFLVVFASGKDRRTPGAPLHTNFRLDNDGEYLALVRPDGTVASEFTPQYAQQFTDVSYGFPVTQTNFTFVSSNASLRLLVPTDGSLGIAWTAPEFDDSAWTAGSGAVGFDTGEVNPGEDTVESIIVGSQPAAYWRFNETSGTTAANLGTNNVSGTYSGVSLGVAGPRPPTYGGLETDNAAAGFNGTSASVTSGSFMSGLSAFTMAGWIRPTAAQANRTGLFGQNDAIEFGFISASTIQIYTPSGGSLNVPWSLPNNQWYHIAVVGNGTDLRVYTNGVLAGVGGSATGSYGSSTFPVNIGGGGIFDTTGNWFNGQIDEVAIWLRALSAQDIQQQYAAALTPTATASYASVIDTDVETAMHDVNSSAYVRYTFVIDDPAAIDRLEMRVRYDDGFAAYLNGDLVAFRNAPLSPVWNSTATTHHPDGQALDFETFAISSDITGLVMGTNVLAIHALNTSASNSDFLVQAELSGSSFGELDTQPRYFRVPTPGEPNGLGDVDLGPIVSAVQNTPALPVQPMPADAITVTARISPTFQPVGGVALYWRVMFDAINQTNMLDDGAHGDGAAGDGVFGAVIPGNVATNGQMIRWFIESFDTLNRTSRWPLFEKPLDSPEYLGTVVVNPDVTSKIPIFEMFVSPTELPKVDTESGGRASFFYDGEFYDNIYVELRGNSSAGLNKKSHRLEFNRDHRLRHLPGYPRVRKTSLVSDYLDPAYMRQMMSFWLLNETGTPAPYYYPVHVRLNGAFYQLAGHNDVVSTEQSERLGYDPNGALYKAAGTIQPDRTSTGRFRKTNPKDNDYTDYTALANGISETLSDAARMTNALDLLDLPNVINYVACARWTSEADDVWANMSLYRDTYGDQLWRIIPFDMNVSWGMLYYNDAPSNFGGIHATNDNYKNHPLYGGSDVLPTVDGTRWNRIYDTIYSVPRFREMYLRRLRTIMDRYIQPPGTPPEQRIFESIIYHNTNNVWTEAFLDRAKWGWPVGMAGYGLGANQWLTNATAELVNLYINPRRIHLFATHSITNSAKPIGVGGTLNAGIPTTQPADAIIWVAAVESNPGSGSQTEEYLALTNANPFAVDISDWKLDGAVRFTFHGGTVIPSNSVVYVSPDLNGFRGRSASPHAAEGHFVVGPYDGQLSSWGEEIVIIDDRGRIVSKDSYDGNPSLAQQYLRITEVMYNPAPLTGDPTDPQEFEYIELKNIGPVPLDLTGIHFTNGIEFTFTGSAVTSLASGETVLVVKNQAAFAARYGTGYNIAGTYVGYLDNAGEVIKLDDAVGEKILEFDYNDSWYPITDGHGFSLVIMDENASWDTWDRKSSWRQSAAVDGSPGGDDGPLPAIAPIIINEALTRSVDPAVDTIELFNPTSGDVNVGGWYLTDDLDQAKKFRIPNGTTIPANDYVLFTEADFNAVGSPTRFALSSEGDEVYLFSGDTNGTLTGYIHGFDFGPALSGVTFGRYVTSQLEEHFVAQSNATPNAANSLPKVGPVVISEIMYHPPDLVIGNESFNNERDEYVELHNITDNPVALFNNTNTWRVRKGIDYDFPPNTSIPAHGFILLVSFDPAVEPEQLEGFRATYGLDTNVVVMGPYSETLDNAGEAVELQLADTPEPGSMLNVLYVLVDRVKYEDELPWPAAADGLGRALNRRDVTAYGNDPINWDAAPPTPGAAFVPGVPPAISNHPQSQTVATGGSATFNVSATGPGPYFYQWRFEGHSLTDATNSSLTLNNVQLEDAGEYSVIVLNPTSSVESDPATLTVQQSATIVAHPQDVAVAPGGEATFSVAARSSSTLTYQWRRDGVNLMDETNATLTIMDVQGSDDAYYDVVVSDAVGSVVSDAARLIVLIYPAFVEYPQSQTVVEGGAVAFSTTTTGTLPMGYRWRFNAPYIYEVVLNSHTSFLTLTNVQMANAGVYRVVITNQAFYLPGYQSAPASLTVLADSDHDGLPDQWETDHGGSVDGSADADGDGMTNAEEYQAGTDYLDPMSVLEAQITSDGTSATITFTAISNHTYSVQFQSPLGSSWNKLADFTAVSTNRTLQATDPAAAAFSRYYRIVTPRVP